MLHELLLALLGYTGDLIIDEREHYNLLGLNHLPPDAPISGEPTFKLAPDISFLEPSERYAHNPLQFCSFIQFLDDDFLYSDSGT